MINLETGASAKPISLMRQDTVGMDTVLFYQKAGCNAGSDVSRKINLSFRALFNSALYHRSPWSAPTARLRKPRADKQPSLPSRGELFHWRRWNRGLVVRESFASYPRSSGVAAATSSGRIDSLCLDQGLRGWR